jgi:arabinan endo-1,5-alpha-L-arabinosidase
MRFGWLDRLLRANPPAVVQPVIGRDFPDPDVLAVGEEYFVYSTNSVYRSQLVRLPVFRASALAGPWSELGEGMPELAGWVADPPNVWAPELAPNPNGGYLLYYTARHAAHQVQCIGVAAADAPTGPFRPIGSKPLVCRPEEGDTLDAESFTDADSTRYLLYKSGRQQSTMWLQRLSPDGLTAVGDRTPILRSDRPEEANIVEAPTLLRRDDGYLLFYSANSFNSGNYFVSYAVAPALAGPYIKQPGALLSSDTLGRAYANPGHQDVVAGPDGDYLVFHAALDGTQRAMFVVGLDWGSDGRPVVTLDRLPAPTVDPVQA